MYRGAFYTACELTLGIVIAGLTVFSIGVGFLMGARDVRHYMRIRKL